MNWVRLANFVFQTTPERKLPALFVLDSVVKNIGGPYTLFLGKNLFRTFMETYSLVNSQVRRKLEELLKTWKEPVPGSRDQRTVFPIEITRPIENALIRWRTEDFKRQQQYQKSQQDLFRTGRPQPPTWRGNPTPPQHAMHYQPPPTPTQSYPPQPMPNGHPPVCTSLLLLDKTRAN